MDSELIGGPNDPGRPSGRSGRRFIGRGGNMRGTKNNPIPRQSASGYVQPPYGTLDRPQQQPSRDVGYYPSRPNITSPDFLPPSHPARPVPVTTPARYCAPRNRSHPVGDTERQWTDILPTYRNTARDDVQAHRGSTFGYGDDWDLRRGMCYGGNELALGPVVPPPTDPLQAPLSSGAYDANLQFDAFTDFGMATRGGPMSANADPSIVGKNARTRNATYLGDPNARPPSHLDPRNIAHMINPGGGMTGAQAGYLPRGTDACMPLGFDWNDRYEVLARTGAVSRSDNANGGPESYRGADPASTWFGPDPPPGEVPEHVATGRTYTFDEQVANYVRQSSRNTAGIDRRIVNPNGMLMEMANEEMDAEARKQWWGNETAYS